MRTWVWVLAILLAGTAVRAQDITAPFGGPLVMANSFEVVSIRKTSSTVHGHAHIWSSSGDGEFRAQNVRVIDLLEFQTGLPESQFVAMGQTKERLYTPRFDLEAKSDAGVDARLHKLRADQAETEKRLMVEALLEEQFGLKMHYEKRQLPIYTLTVAKGGPKFTKSTATGTSYSTERGAMTIEGGEQTVAMMTFKLAPVVGRPVMDETGIKGQYLMKLRWMPEDGSPARNTDGTDASLPSIFTALEEQLGLKLVAGKGSVHVMVVDHVKMPPAN